MWRRDRKEPSKTSKKPQLTNFVVKITAESYVKKMGNQAPVSDDSSSDDDAQGSTAVGQDTEP